MSKAIPACLVLSAPANVRIFKLAHKAFHFSFFWVSCIFLFPPSFYFLHHHLLYPIFLFEFARTHTSLVTFVTAARQGCTPRLVTVIFKISPVSAWGSAGGDVFMLATSSLEVKFIFSEMLDNIK
jgi:hypothetical protein